MTNYELHCQLLKRGFMVRMGTTKGLAYDNLAGYDTVRVFKDSIEVIHRDTFYQHIDTISSDLSKCYVDPDGTLHLDTFTI